MERTCPSCGTTNPNAARFCMSCGTPLDVAPAAEEVRQVTILFADLVGFTQRSDNADPEDVRRVLVPFHRAAKAAIEAQGGTLDKFIGDAAMGVFGAPVAHDDDPARAVRAGLALLAHVEEIRASVDPDASIRVAVETGDAVVAFGTGPQVGEAVAGDVVNTASRMQSIAPPGGLVVGERTWQAVRDRFEAEPMGPVAVKGKAEPVRSHRITGLRATALETVPLMGRDDDLGRLDAALDAARRGPARAVTIIAPPGLGKTRLVGAFLGGAEGVRTYRIGFSPQGDDSAFGPFADLVADIADVPRHADPAVLDEAVDQLVADAAIPDEERGGVRRRLRAVLGADAKAGTPEGPRDVAETLARVLQDRDPGPTVLVVEDTHWAGPAARAVLARLEAAFADAPVLLVCTARPELRAEVDGIVGEPWELEPLDAAATRAVLAAAAGGELSDEAAARIADRAEGNPLFAIEFGRTIDEGGDAAVPTSVRAVIAARLDALPAGPRDLLLDAAVVGATFWAGALDAIDADRDVAAMLDELAGRGMVAASDASRLGDEPDLAFSHALIRDEAYGRLPRAARATRHLAVGTWLEARAGDAASSFAAALARHYGEAALAGRSAGATEVVDAATPCAIEWLVVAGEQVFRLDGEGAFTMFERALEFGATGALAERALYGSAVVGRRIGSLPGPEVLDRYRRALASARERGDRQSEGLQMVRIGSQLAAMGESAQALGSYDEAIALLETEPPGMPLGQGYLFRAEEEMFAGHSAASLELVERGLALVRDGGNQDLVIMGLHLRGDARCSMGDRRGVDDLAEALELARAHSGTAEVATSLAYVGDWVWQFEGPRAGREVFEEGVRITRQAGIASQGMWSKTHLMLVSSELGDWDLALDLAADLLMLGADKLDASLDVLARAERSMILLRRGRIGEVDGPEKVVHLAEGSHELQAQAPAFAYAAEHAHAVGDEEGVRRAIERLAELTEDAVTIYRASVAPTMTRLAVATGDVDLGERFLAPLTDLPSMREQLHTDAARAVLAQARSESDAADRYRDVAERWRAYGDPFEEAQALLGLARTAGEDAAAARAASLLDGLGIGRADEGGTTT